jgi:hypothetical protein
MQSSKMVRQFDMCRNDQYGYKSISYLNQLASEYPSPAAVAEAIINLAGPSSNFPKGTEHFISDIHGEYEAFCEGREPRLRRHTDAESSRLFDAHSLSECRKSESGCADLRT